MEKLLCELIEYVFFMIQLYIIFYALSRVIISIIYLFLRGIFKIFN